MVQSSSPLDKQLLLQLDKLHRPKGNRGGRKRKKERRRRGKKREKGKKMRLGTFPNVASFLSTAGLA